ncbi:S8 family serine peptidase [Luminiphilus sp.]|nr:S8 family serine peptidase [Luminiphilus sp.]MDA9625350.1 S8 family serine peptidase [Luminiphilus sp.]
MMFTISLRHQAKYSLKGLLLLAFVWGVNVALVAAQEVEDQVSEIVSEATEERIEQVMEDFLADIESRLSEDGLRIQTDHWLVMAEADVFEQLAQEGYLFDRVSELSGLGFLLAEVAAPASFDLSATRAGIYEVIGGQQADVDLNHLYTAGVPDPQNDEQPLVGLAPRELLPPPTDLSGLTLRIGIIDSSIDQRHNAFSNSSITTQRFVDNDSPPNAHGTAIASIIASNDPQALGLAPSAQIYAAEVFDHNEQQGEFASTVSLIKALSWLMTQDVSVINISLAGPSNRLLETALIRVREKGVLAIAAAGNGGPMAQPMYPAAYPEVVAVTATDDRGRAFRLANRGEYVDIAAPGVNIRHAQAGGGFAASSGTSYAVPFVTVAAARLLQSTAEPALMLDALYASARDIGAPGRDQIYGYGQLQF